MKQLITLLLALVGSFMTAQAQDADHPCDSLCAESPAECIFNGEFVCEETGLQLHLDLVDESIEIPGMSFLGPTYGYLDGKTNNHVYGVWMLMRFSIEGNKAKLRFTNDIGSDSQDVVLTKVDETTYQYTATGTNSIRKVEGRKLVKIPNTMTLRRIDK